MDIQPQRYPNRNEQTAMTRRGMTLVELLVVLLVVAILASIFSLRMREATEAARMATVRADLRSFAMAEHVFHARHDRYAAVDELTEFQNTQGVETNVAWTSDDGFAATAWHATMVDRVCGVFMGPAPEGAAGPAGEPGVVTCE